MNAIVKPLRVILTGAPESTAFAVELFVRSGDTAVMPIPVVGACLRVGMRPELWHSAMSSMMACHPQNIVFTRGTRDDHRWIIARRGLILNITETLDVEVRLSYDDRTPYWTDTSSDTLSQKLNAAMKICNILSRDAKKHEIPPVYSAFAAYA